MGQHPRRKKRHYPEKDSRFFNDNRINNGVGLSSSNDRAFSRTMHDFHAKTNVHSDARARWLTHPCQHVELFSDPQHFNSRAPNLVILWKRPFLARNRTMQHRFTEYLIWHWSSEVCSFPYITSSNTGLISEQNIACIACSAGVLPPRCNWQVES